MAKTGKNWPQKVIASFARSWGRTAIALALIGISGHLVQPNFWDFILWCASVAVALTTDAPITAYQFTDPTFGDKLLALAIIVVTLGWHSYMSFLDHKTAMEEAKALAKTIEVDDEAEALIIGGESLQRKNAISKEARKRLDEISADDVVELLRQKIEEENGVDQSAED